MTHLLNTFQFNQVFSWNLSCIKIPKIINIQNKRNCCCFSFAEKSNNSVRSHYCDKVSTIICKYNFSISMRCIAVLIRLDIEYI